MNTATAQPVKVKKEKYHSIVGVLTFIAGGILAYCIQVNVAVDDVTPKLLLLVVPVIALYFAVRLLKKVRSTKSLRDDIGFVLGALAVLALTLGLINSMSLSAEAAAYAFLVFVGLLLSWVLQLKPDMKLKDKKTKLRSLWSPIVDDPDDPANNTATVTPLSGSTA